MGSDSWDALSFGAPTSVLKALPSTIQARHLEAGLDPHISGKHALTRMVQALSSFQGRQSLRPHPIHKSAVADLLSSDSTTLHQWHDLLAAATATLACLRPSKGAALQVCDLWLNWDARAHAGDFAGTAAGQQPSTYSLEQMITAGQGNTSALGELLALPWTWSIS